MCAIFGIYRKSGLTINDRWSLRRMADAMKHRGPDGEGFHIDKLIGLGMRRLAIIDPNTGWQPLYNEDETLVLVANGEIYNHVELRHELITLGHKFTTGSDCETILHLYEEYGEKCVDHLRGMFAFAIFNKQNKSLFIARDRMGEKPLMLAVGDEWFAFSSELIGLVGAEIVPFILDIDAIKLYYHWGFVPEPLSPVLGTHKLPAGNWIKINLETRTVEQHEYWSLQKAPALQDEPIQKIISELEELSKIVFRSDRPIAVALSAGVDSSAMLAFAARYAEQPVEAISIGYEGNKFQDESWLAKKYANEIGIKHHRIELTTEQVVSEFPKMCFHRDEPICDIAGSSMYALAGVTRKLNIPVLISGLGGDELFWGYEWHRQCVEKSKRAARLRSNNGSILEYISLRSPPPSIVGIMNWISDGAGIITELKQYLRDRKSNEYQTVFFDNTRDFNSAYLALTKVSGELMSNSHVKPDSLFCKPKYWDMLDVSLTELICSTYLRSNGLCQTDRIFMSQSVESRVPFVDYRLAEVVIGLRKTNPDHLLPAKSLIRAAFKGLIPDQILNRRKRGFSPPWRTWMPELMKTYGPELKQGILVDSGIISQSGANYLSAGIDIFQRPIALSFSSLILEQWARGMKFASINSRPSLDQEPNFHSIRRI